MGDGWRDDLEKMRQTRRTATITALFADGPESNPLGFDLSRDCLAEALRWLDSNYWTRVHGQHVPPRAPLFPAGLIGIAIGIEGTDDCWTNTCLDFDTADRGDIEMVSRRLTTTARRTEDVREQLKAERRAVKQRGRSSAR